MIKFDPNTLERDSHIFMFPLFLNLDDRLVFDNNFFNSNFINC